MNSKTPIIWKFPNGVDGEATLAIVAKNLKAIGYSHDINLVSKDMLGKIIGKVTLTDVVTDSKDPWYIPGHLGLVLKNPQPLLPFIPLKGKVGLFDITKSLIGG